MRRSVAWLLAVLLSALAVVVAADPGSWRAAAPGHVWRWPADHYARRDYKTEWWYFTGHLDPADAGDPAGTLGFQLTFFRVGVVPGGRPDWDSDWAAADLVLAHAALTGPGDAGHRFSEVLWRETPLLGGFGAPGDSLVAWCRAPAGTDAVWSLERTPDGDFLLSARDDARDLRFALRCTPSGPPVLHGAGGFSPKNADGTAGSLYYSYPRLACSGSVGAAARPVTGSAWMDREIFTSTLAPGQSGWDWLSLQLDDGRSLMLYRLRGNDPGARFALGTLIDRERRTTPLPAESWRLEPLERWTSPETGADYPVRWRLRIPGAALDLELRATRPDQENVSPRAGVHYWEGAVTARPWPGTAGTAAGRGFVELTGYGRGSRPPV